MVVFGSRKPTSYLSLRDLMERRAVKTAKSGIIDARRSVQILLIDDEELSALPSLKSNSFKVIRVEGVERIDEVQDYPVVMVDLLGVGKSLNPVSQGAHLIQQIKKVYPEKYVIAYTGGGTAALTSLAVESADRYTTKDINIEKWCDLLDVAVAEVSNPVALWSKFRHRLLNQGVTPFQLTELEDAYVRGLLSDNQDLPRTLNEKAIAVGIDQDVRNVIAGLVANTIFALAGG